MTSERARVLITVKASPEPSTTYGDTVCVAGIRLLPNDAVSWVRIYPIAFRHFGPGKQFNKYEVIEVDLARSTKDTRTESYRPNWDSLVRSNQAPLRDAARGRILAKLIGPSMCDLRRGVEADLTAQSLGLVEVRKLRGLKFEHHGPWTDKQIASMAASLSQPDLLGQVDKTPMLVAPRFKVNYSYLCADDDCKGHEPRILDWELNALQYRFRNRSDDELKAIITTKFLDEMWNDKVRTYFFVGNFADMVKRRNFSVLGIYRPPRDADWGSTLF